MTLKDRVSLRGETDSLRDVRRAGPLAVDTLRCANYLLAPIVV